MTIFAMYTRVKTIPLTANQGLIHVVNKYPTFLEPGQLSDKVEDLMPNYLVKLFAAWQNLGYNIIFQHYTVVSKDFDTLLVGE